MSTDLSWTQSATPLPVPPVTVSGDAAVQPPRAVPPPTARTVYVVLAHLATGDRIEVAAHDDEPSARAEATALMRYLRDGRGDWPYLAGRFVRPEAIVSVDIDATPA